MGVLIIYFFLALLFESVHWDWTVAIILFLFDFIITSKE